MASEFSTVVTRLRVKAETAVVVPSACGRVSGYSACASISSRSARRKSAYPAKPSLATKRRMVGALTLARSAKSATVSMPVVG